MSLMQKIKEDQLIARKARNTVKASLLTTLIGEAAVIGKNDGNRESTDVEVVAVVKKFLKGIEETLKHTIDLDTFIQLEAEKNILDKYLPKQMCKEQIITLFNNLQASNIGCTKGQLMKLLKDNFAGQYDGKVAAQAVDEYLKG